MINLCKRESLSIHRISESQRKFIICRIFKSIALCYEDEKGPYSEISLLSIKVVLKVTYFRLTLASCRALLDHLQLSLIILLFI